MTGARASIRAGLVALAAAAAVVLAVFWGRSRGRPPASPGTAASPTAAPAEPRVVAPVVEVDAQGALLKVSHKDPSGRVPLEYVETPEGTLTIRRTFDASGRLLKEEAFRDNQPVPMPPVR
jgi:hypothetical protein